MDNNLLINGSKGILAMITGIFIYVAGSITELVIVLVFLMILDYITGMIAGYIQKKWSSSIGLKGAVKKVGFIFLVLIAILTDYVIVQLGAKIGITLGFVGVFTFAVTCWLISTELLSITENLGRMGVTIPKFLRIAFTKLKDVSEKVGGEAAEKIKEGEQSKCK
ncbi:phage holin family protein [Abyssisolibacter fermentans]|uniref:phage holin family protein n=1 Tax=Abyssisolibacter fermentans TaxID=1766203 RepID=UPI000835F6B6|nr:phage holin family protein [Abyssisolibacter fermentans]